MPTLSTASLETKQVIKSVIIFIIAIALIFMIIKVVIIMKDTFFPPAPVKPTMAFGVLPAQTFPNNIVDNKFSYNINTVSGDLPAIAQQIKVYRIKKNVPDLLAVNKIDTKVKSIGFNQGYNTVTDKIFEWKSNPKSQEIYKTLTANMLTGDFRISSEFFTDPRVLSGENLRKEADAIAQVKGMLFGMELASSDLDLENIKTNLYLISNATIIPASSFSQAQVIETYIPQKDINKIKVIYEKPNSSNISFFFGGGNRMQIVAAQYVHHSVSDESSTYQLKSTMQAFNELKNGDGYIASYSGNSNNVSINEVTLAYYMTSQTQDFLMPVYVFTGSDEFSAYVSAITDESISR